jgi:hypothetical protein
MATSWTAIASVTVGSGGAGTISFTSIPSTYTDLCLKYSARSNNSNTIDYVYINFNSNGYNASMRWIQGTGSSVNGGSEATGYLGTIDGNTATASTFGSTDVYIPNYAGSTNKSFSVDNVQETNATAAYMQLLTGLWSNTSAITSITMKPDVNSFLQYSTATLFGIKNS